MGLNIGDTVKVDLSNYSDYEDLGFYVIDQEMFEYDDTTSKISEVLEYDEDRCIQYYGIEADDGAYGWPDTALIKVGGHCND